MSVVGVLVVGFVRLRSWVLRSFCSCFCSNKPMLLDNDDIEPSGFFDRRCALTCL